MVRRDRGNPGNTTQKREALTLGRRQKQRVRAEGKGPRPDRYGAKGAREAKRWQASKRGACTKTQQRACEGERNVVTRVHAPLNKEAGTQKEKLVCVPQSIAKCVRSGSLSACSSNATAKRKDRGSEGSTTQKRQALTLGAAKTKESGRKATGKSENRRVRKGRERQRGGKVHAKKRGARGSACSKTQQSACEGEGNMRA